MLDFGFDKLALIGAVALVVIGPEKLPRVARTVGTLLGKAQRYVADVKAEVNRSIELDELKKMKTHVEDGVRDMQNTVHKEFSEVSQSFDSSWSSEPLAEPTNWTPGYKRPDKNWRIKRSSTPQWFKQRAGVRRHVQSGAARVARFRPRKLG
ncbi:MAG TPA: Sec-independent protein translocase protein TatB [Burkholderiaceae bacterium]